MGSGFMLFNASVSSRSAVGTARRLPGILLAIALAATPVEVFAGGSHANSSGSRPAPIAVCTEAHGTEALSHGLAPLWTLAVPGAFAAHSSSLQIELDPETGTWGVASPVRGSLQMHVEAAALSRVSEDLIEEPLANGGMSLHLRGRFQTLAVAGRSADGGVRFSCAEDAIGLYEWLRPEAPALDAAGRPVK